MPASIKQCLVEIPCRATARALQPLFDAILADENRYLTGSATWDVADLATGTQESKDVTVTGAAIGDFVVASLGVDIADMAISAQVVATDTVAVTVLNETGGNVNLASTTVRAFVIPRAAYQATNLTA